MNFSIGPDPGEAVKQARKFAFNSLKIRNRSEQEIRVYLIKKKCSPEVIAEVIPYLQKAQLLNDRQFARDWIRMRLRKPWGIRRIFFELQHKGIEPEVLKEEIAAATEDYSSQETLTELAAKRIEKYKNLDGEKAKKRLFQYLAQRGFDLGDVKKVVGKLYDRQRN